MPDWGNDALFLARSFRVFHGVAEFVIVTFSFLSFQVNPLRKVMDFLFTKYRLENRNARL